MKQETLTINLTIPEKSNNPIVSPAVGLAEAVEKNVYPNSTSNPFDLGEALTRKPDRHIERKINDGSE